MPLVKVIDVLNCEYSHHRNHEDDSDRGHYHTTLDRVHTILTYCPSRLPENIRKFDYSRDTLIMVRGYFPQGIPWGVRISNYDIERWSSQNKNGQPLTDPDEISFFEYFKEVMTGREFVTTDLIFHERFVDSSLLG